MTQLGTNYDFRPSSFSSNIVNKMSWIFKRNKHEDVSTNKSWFVESMNEQIVHRKKINNYGQKTIFYTKKNNFFKKRI